ncbi:hypothetical protein EV648_11698 [Kribbella sp. VKM Ac-2568]|nr:hypothetical protein EV648_11698 [Kribbella sp. VKM Ac-2568]
MHVVAQLGLAERGRSHPAERPVPIARRTPFPPGRAACSHRAAHAVPTRPSGLFPSRGARRSHSAERAPFPPCRVRPVPTLQSAGRSQPAECGRPHPHRRGGSRAPLRDGASRDAVRQERLRRPFGIEQARLLTHPIPTRERRSYADPAQGSEPGRGGVSRVGLVPSDRQYWVPRLGSRRGMNARAVCPATTVLRCTTGPRGRFRAAGNGCALIPVMALAVAGSTTDGFVDHRRIPLPAGWLFANWRLVRGQRPNSPSSGKPGAWRGAADGGGRCSGGDRGQPFRGVADRIWGVVVGTGDTFWAGWPVVVWLWGPRTGCGVMGQVMSCPRTPQGVRGAHGGRGAGLCAPGGYPERWDLLGWCTKCWFRGSPPPLASPVLTGLESTAALPRLSHIMDRKSQ